MARERVLVLGLDCFEISLAEQLMERGDLPTLAARRDVDAHARLDPGADQRTGLAWEQFWSGLSPQAAHRESAVEFDPATYAVWQEGARFRPFFEDITQSVVVFDAPYVDLARAPGVQGVVAWGAHDPGLSTPTSEPRGLLREMERRVGPYPGDPWLYAAPWASPEGTRQMGRDLVAGVDARSRAAQWLLGERFDDWELGVVVVSEPHSGAEGLWHGIDPTHPLYDAPSGRAAGEALTEVYRATDRLVRDVIAAADPTTVIVFSMGGMGPNRSDAATMAILPELLLRWSLGEERLALPAHWAATPDAVPVGDEADVTWARGWFRGVPSAADVPPRSIPSRLASLLPAGAQRRIRRARTQRRDAERPLGFRDLDWQPATWYSDRWPEMRAFVLPSFYDGRIRVNLRGRESSGIVEHADYRRVCDELEELVRACTDPRTGASVVESIERPGADDPYALDSALADLIVVWAACPLAFEHPSHGTIGPMPYRRTGGHTSPYGFASVTGPDVVPGDYGIAAALDIAPTVYELLAGRPPTGISGTSLAATLTGSAAAH